MNTLWLRKLETRDATGQARRIYRQIVGPRGN